MSDLAIVADEQRPAIAVAGLTKTYEPVPRWMKVLARSASRRAVVALAGIDLTVSLGTICAVVGPNGAGKSTLFRILMGLTTPTAGSARVLGLDCSVRSEARNMSIGFMPSDERTLLLRLSCRENLIFQSRLRGYTGRRLESRVDQVLDLVDLGAKRDTAAFSLSSGMKARLQLARALVHEPRVVLLDEPTSAVDPVAAYDLLELIRRLTKEQSLAVLLSSHRLEEIDALDESVLLLDRGRVLFNGDLRELRRMAVLTEVTIDFDDPPSAERARVLLEARARPIIESVERSDRSLEVVASEHLGTVLSLLTEEVEHIVHVNEHSGSTRNLLQRMYRSDLPTEDPAT